MLSSLLRKQLLIPALFVFQFVTLLPKAFGASCLTQAQMTPAQRETLSNTARMMAMQIQVATRRVSVQLRFPP